MVEYMAIGLGALSLIISVVAVWIAIGSDRRMKALSNLEFQEKLAVLARYVGKVGADKSVLRAERLRNNLAAATSIKNYVTIEQREKLIRDYMIPILKEYLSDEMEQGLAITVKEIIDIVRSYGIELSEIEIMRQHLRGLEQLLPSATR